ncbi:MAG: LysR family transcriptional regulator [Bacteroidia bacterium]|jgi:LysR family hydrogen peroxide-inducible transcriptional activator|nr:LysR family transcriptional regulator [Bacteroidia bacterium]
MLVTLRQLQYVIALADTGTFSKAAILCNAEQSTVSQQIKVLEEKLGVVIFNRSKQPVKITEEGERIVEQAREILDKVEDLIKPFKAAPKRFDP